MAWVRVEPDFPRHPKSLKVGPLGRELFVAALCHSVEFMTDGWIGMDELKLLGRYEGLFTEGVRTLPGVSAPVAVEDVIEGLIAAGLMTYRNGRLLIHDYHLYQPLKVDTIEKRARWKEQKRRQRAGVLISPEILSAVDPEESYRENLRVKDEVGARDPGRCPDCGVEHKTAERLREHIEVVHAEVVAAPPPEWRPQEMPS